MYGKSPKTEASEMNPKRSDFVFDRQTRVLLRESSSVVNGDQIGENFSTHNYSTKTTDVVGFLRI